VQETLDVHLLPSDGSEGEGSQASGLLDMMDDQSPAWRAKRKHVFVLSRCVA
jgi:hypothetical protein